MKTSGGSTIKIPEREIFTPAEVCHVTRLSERVIEYWQREFGGIAPVADAKGRRFYIRRDIEKLLTIKQLFILEKRGKKEVTRIMKKQFPSKPGEKEQRHRKLEKWIHRMPDPSRIPDTNIIELRQKDSRASESRVSSSSRSQSSSSPSTPRNDEILGRIRRGLQDILTMLEKDDKSRP